MVKMSYPYIYAYIEDRQLQYIKQYNLLQKAVIKPNSKKLEDVYERVMKK